MPPGRQGRSRRGGERKFGPVGSGGAAVPAPGIVGGEQGPKQAHVERMPRAVTLEGADDRGAGQRKVAEVMTKPARWRAMRALS